MFHAAFASARGNHGKSRVVVDFHGRPLLELLPSGTVGDEVVVREPGGPEICEIGRPVATYAAGYEIRAGGDRWAHIASKGLLRLRYWLAFADGTRIDLEGDFARGAVALVAAGSPVAHMTPRAHATQLRDVEVDPDVDVISTVVAAVAVDAWLSCDVTAAAAGRSMNVLRPVAREAELQRQQRRTWDRVTQTNRQAHDAAMAAQRRAMDFQRQSINRMNRGY